MMACTKPLLTTNQYKVTHHSASVGNSADGKLAVLLSYMPAHGATCAVSPARLKPGDRTTIASSGCGLRGYRLLGWSTDPDATTPDNRFGLGGAYTMPDRNVTLYPVLATLPPTISTESRTVTRTIRVSPDALHAEDTRQVVSLTREVRTDAVTGVKTYGPWTTGVWDAREAPQYDGWVPRVKQVPLVNVTSDTADTTVMLPYDPTVRFESDAKPDIRLPDTQAVAYNHAAVSPAGGWTVGSTTARAGYVFRGWTLDSTDYGFPEPVMKPLVLKARWERVPAPVIPVPSATPAAKAAPVLAHTGAAIGGVVALAITLLTVGVGAMLARRKARH